MGNNPNSRYMHSRRVRHKVVTEEFILISVELIVQEVATVSNDMSDRDRRLFNFAKTKIAEERMDLTGVRVLVDFQDKPPVFIEALGGGNGRIFIGFDENDELKYIWENMGTWRLVKYFFVESFGTLIEAIRVYVPRAAGNIAVHAIGGAAARYIQDTNEERIRGPPEVD